jgi:hypothetical protein
MAQHRLSDMLSRWTSLFGVEEFGFRDSPH